MANEGYWIAMIKHENDFYILGHREGGGQIVGKPSEKEMCDFFTNGYDQANLRGLKGMSTTIISNIRNSPKVVHVTNEDLEQKLLDLDAGVHQINFGTTLGFLKGLKCNRDAKTVKKIYDSGKSPELMSPIVGKIIYS